MCRASDRVFQEFEMKNLIISLKKGTIKMSQKKLKKV